MKRVAIVGGGKIGMRHLEAYGRIGGVEVVGVVEPDDRQAASLPDGLRRFASLDEAADERAVDVIDVCTPTPLHFDHVTRALEAEKLVFCEKPLVTTVAEAEKLAALTGSGRGSLRVGYVYRFHPRMQRLKARIDAGALGDVHLATLRIGGRGSHRAWKHRRDSGGGALLDMATHMLDLAYWLFGSFEEIDIVSSRLLVPQRTIDGEVVAVDAEDDVVVRLSTAGVGSIFVHADFVTPGFMHSVEVAGTNGSAFTSIVTALPDRYFLVDPGGDLQAGETVTAGMDADMLAAELESFLRDAERGVVANDVDSSVEIARVVEEFRARG